MHKLGYLLFCCFASACGTSTSGGLNFDAAGDTGGPLRDGGSRGESDGGRGRNAADGRSPADAQVGPDATPNPSMSFFVTSTGSGANGGNLGGLAGADAKCQNLATNGGAGGRTWHAYLSTGSMGPGTAGSARDRIGTGPWYNQEGTIIAANIAMLHSNGLLGNVVLDELGGAIPSNEHDVLTGTQANGTISSDTETCDNWTNATVNSQAEVGHADTQSGDGESWNGQHSGSCDQASLMGNAGAGRLYCFAID